MVSIVTIFFVSIIVFVLLEFTPGDPAELILGWDGTKESIAQLRAELGLDQPIQKRYVRFLIDALKGDFGRSYITTRPVTEEIRRAFPVTLQISAASLIISIVIGMSVGVISAARQYSLIDQITRFFVLIAYSIPIFWLGLMLILLFSVKLRILPSFGWGDWKHIILPSVSLSIYSVAVIARMTRSSMLEVLRSEYITTSRAKGTPESIVIYKHALKNALIPVVTVIGLQFGFLLGGAVLTETVFALPGVGRLMVKAIFLRDYPIIRAGILMVSVCFIFINLVVDIIYRYIDPSVDLTET
jgi:peptide/nickel transport system permease protein